MRILVVEDERPLRSFLMRGFREAGHDVDEAADGDAALRRAAARHYDVVVLDLMLPDRDGLDVLRALRDTGAEVPVLVLTARDALEDRIEGLDSGADDYVPKPFAFAELLARVRALSRRGVVAPSVVEVADLRIDLVARSVRRRDREIELTAREYALLEFLARHADQVVTRTMIAEHVWGTRFDTFSNVIDVYIRYLRRKSDDPFERKLIHTRRGVGYLLSAT